MGGLESRARRCRDPVLAGRLDKRGPHRNQGLLPSKKSLTRAKKPGAFRARLLVALALEFLQQLALALASGSSASRPRPGCTCRLQTLERSTGMPLPFRRNCLPLSEPSGIFTRVVGAIERRHIDLAAERGRRHRDRHLAEDVGAVALEELVRLDRQEDVEIAGRAAAQDRPRLRPQGGCACRPRRRPEC